MMLQWYNANAKDNDNDNANDNDIDIDIDIDNDNKIELFRHYNRNNTITKAIFKQMTMLDKCNCI